MKNLNTGLKLLCIGLGLLMMACGLMAGAQSIGTGLTLSVNAPNVLNLSKSAYGPSKGYPLTVVASDPGGVSSTTIAGFGQCVTSQAHGASHFSTMLTIYPYYYAGSHSVFVQSNGAHGVMSENITVNILP